MFSLFLPLFLPKPFEKGVLLYVYHKPNKSPATKGVFSIFALILPKPYHKEWLKKVSEYDQEISQSQTADFPVAPRGRAA